MRKPGLSAGFSFAPNLAAKANQWQKCAQQKGEADG
jgi:hypothetical protein